MHTSLTALSFLVIMFFAYIPLYGDIIITRDGMTLNGKVTDQSGKNHVIFSNTHGTFTIDRSKIREMHITDSYNADMKLLEKTGQKVDEEKIKLNYQAGLKSLGEQTPDIKREEPPLRGFSIFMAPYYQHTIGRIGKEIPSSYGGSVYGSLPLGDYSGIKIVISYIRAEKDEKSVEGPGISAGPVWHVPLSMPGFSFQLMFSMDLGIGRYAIKGIDRRINAYKWNAGCMTGPLFSLGPVLISPHARFDYIYDERAALYGLGFGIAAGYRFSK